MTPRHPVRWSVCILAVALVGCGGDAKGPGEAPPAQSPPTSTTTPERAEEPSPANPWTESAAAELIAGGTLRLRRPSEVEVRPLEERLTLRYTGPESPANSEITDGYLVTIQPIDPDSVAAVIDAAGAGSGVRTIDWLGTEVTEFERRSELGNQPIRHVLTPAGFRGVPVPLDIAIHVSGDRRAAYEEEVERILGTMRWNG